MTDDDKTTTCGADEIVPGPPLHLDYTIERVAFSKEELDRRKAENAAAEQIAAWLDEHKDDDEFQRDDGLPGGCDWTDVEALIATIRDGRWRK